MSVSVVMATIWFLKLKTSHTYGSLLAVALFEMKTIVDFYKYTVARDLYIVSTSGLHQGLGLLSNAFAKDLSLILTQMYFQEPPTAVNGGTVPYDVKDI